MNALLMTLFSLLVADPNVPCEVHPVHTQAGTGHAVICIIEKPLVPVDASHVPALLEPLLKRETNDTAPVPESPGEAAPRHSEEPIAPGSMKFTIPRGTIVDRSLF